MSAKSSEFILTIWEGDYGIPSVDVDSLIIFTYLKFLKVECLVKYSSNPLICSIPKLCLINNGVNREISGFLNIWTYLKKYNSDLNSMLSPTQKSESYVYINYIKNSLLPGLCFTIWVDEKNYSDVTRKWFRNSMPFPFNFLYPYYKVNQITQYVKMLTPEQNLETYSSLILNEAKQCISVLSVKLGNKDYFFGSQPSTLDAVIYGYIAQLLNAPLPSSHLQSFLKEQENLVKFFKRITVLLYPQMKMEYKYVTKLQPEDDIQDFKSSFRSVAVASFCVATVMISYGIVNGIIKVSDGNL